MEAGRRRRTDAQRSVDTIIEAAREVLAVDPTAELRLIAERSRLHRSTVYRHFPTREKLVAAVYDDYVDKVTASMVSLDARAPDILAELRRVTLEVLRLADRWRPFRYSPPFPDTVNERRDQMIAAVVAVMERGLAEGLLREDLTAWELCTAWSVPLPYASTLIEQGAWSFDEAADFMLVLIVPRR
jgi:AcrR family transcriptional regulator